MIYVRKCLILMENTRRNSFLKIGPKRFRNVLNYRAFSSQGEGADPPQFDGGRWFTPGEAQEMSRRRLQKWCKKVGIRANTKTIQMRADLLDFHENVLSNSDILRCPFIPMQNPQTNMNMTSHVRQEKLLFNHHLAISTDTGLGQVRYFKNTPIDESVFEDAVFYSPNSEGLELKDISPEQKLPSVSKVLRTTAPKSKLFAISHWTKKQKELLGEDAFRDKMNEIKRKGSEFHAFVHQCLVNRKLNNEVPERLQGYLSSTRKVFDKLADAIASEKSVHHEFLRYQGKLDTLACYHGNPCIIEWKTSQKRKSSLAECGDYPMQMMAYAGAVNSDPMYQVQVRHGVLVIAYEDGSPADVHFLDFRLCRSYWQDWLVRLHQFRNK